jgi:hypothetical protein
MAPSKIEHAPKRCDLAGLPLVTSGGNGLNRNLSYRNLLLYLALLGHSARFDRHLGN